MKKLTADNNEVKNAVPMSIKLDDIHGAEWNTHSKEGKRDEAFKGLVQSIRTNGLIQRIAVRKIPSGYEIIDGHRRVAALREIGAKDVACDVYAELSDAEAKLRTATANLQRCDDNPILWAELIGGLVEGGMTLDAIAAKVGKDYGFVARRARLTSLTDKWSKAFKKHPLSVKTMEQIAAYEAELQDRIFDEEVGEGGLDDIDDEFNILDAFDNALLELNEDVPFDTAPCKGCVNNTNSAAFLFPELSGECGHCQNAECFRNKWNSAVDAEIAKLRAKKIEIKEVAEKYRVPNYWTATATKRKGANPYVYTDRGLKRIIWAIPKSNEEVGGTALTVEEKAAAKELKKAQREWKKNRNSATDKIRSMITENVEEFVGKLVVTAGFTDWVVKKLVEEYDGYIMDDEILSVYSLIYGKKGFKLDALTIDEFKALTSEEPKEVK